MYALVFDRTLRVAKNQPMPTAPAGEALIRVLRAGVCNTDLEIVRGYMGFAGVLGHEFVGVVADCPAEAREAWLGKRVVGEISCGCGRSDCPHCRAGDPRHCPGRTVLGILGRPGAFAEYLTLPVANLHAVPDAVADEEAVFAEPLAACFEILDQVPLRPSDRAVVLGDGKLGLLAAQVLRLAGAQVGAVGRHPAKLAILERLGIETYSGDRLPAAGADVVVEATGSPAGLELAMGLVRPRGTIVLKSTVADRLSVNLAALVIDEITVVGSRCGRFGPALAALGERRIDVRPLISATYPLASGVEAFARAAEPGVIKMQVAMGGKLNRVGVWSPYHPAL